MFASFIKHWLTDFQKIYLGKRGQLEYDEGDREFFPNFTGFIVVSKM